MKSKRMKSKRMKSKRMKLYFTSLFFLFVLYNYAQLPTISDCLGAIPVCNEIYDEINSTTDAGNYTNEISSNNCVQIEQNSTWYTFTVQQDGDFGFLLTPKNIKDDYDWTLFNLTGKSCSDTWSDPTMVVSCNAAGGETCDGITGADGSTNYSYQNFGCGNFPPSANGGFSAKNAFIPVKKGETYALVIINWTGSSFGYTIDFGLGNVDLFDKINPTAEISLPPNNECNLSEVLIDFSEFVDCSTLTNFAATISGPGGPYTLSFESENCKNGGRFDSKATLKIFPSLILNGIYTISLNNTITDLCGNSLIPTSINYEIDLKDVVENNKIDVCKDEFYNLNVNDFQAIKYTWEDGSTNPNRIISENGINQYSVFIEFACATRTENYTFNYLPLPEVVDFESKIEYCEKSNGSIHITSTIPQTGISYSLDNIIYQSSNTFENLAAGNYNVYIKNSEGCIDKINILVEAEPSQTTIELQEVYELKFGESITLNPIINGQYSDFYWLTDSSSLSCISCLNPIATPDLNTIYTFKLIDIDGCAITASTYLKVEIPRDVYVPNVFTPNNDGINEHFTVYGGRQVVNIKNLRVYNRWGELIFDKSDLKPNDEDSGWNGRSNNLKVNAGMYAWIAEIEFIDGFTQLLNGAITILP